LPLHSKKHIHFTLNGEHTEVAFAPHKTLLEVLREDLNLTGTKHGCELGECGTCAVLVDGRSILSCLMLGLDAEGREVKTAQSFIRYKRRSQILARRNVATVHLAFSSLPKNY
jgi:aerobic-type carbon monoxide dehydrogenase small subunit (CoxS/CutS family)